MHNYVSPAIRPLLCVSVKSWNIQGEVELLEKRKQTNKLWAGHEMDQEWYDRNDQCHTLEEAATPYIRFPKEASD